MACRLAAIFAILALSLHLLSLSGNATTFTITNNCDYTVWPGILSNAGVAPLSTTGFSLQKGKTRSINPPSGWAGRFWGRTFCSTDQKTGNFTCLTGDCGSGKIDCSGADALPPATLAEFALDASNGMDFYDVSLVDGYNLAMLVAPRGGGGNCSFIGCVSDLNGACPSQLRVMREGEENAVACRSPCQTFKLPEYCCRGSYGTPDTCKPTDYSLLFKKACPRAYSYLFDDDKNSMFTCNGSPDYTITFCSTLSTSLFSTPSNTLPASSPSPHPFLAHNYKRKKAKEMEVIVGIAVPIAVMGLLIALYSTYHIRRKAKMSLFLDIRNVLEDFTTAESLTFELETLQVATNFFSNDRKLGGGGFGNVYKGTLPNGQDIAVKRLSRISDQGIESFKNEAVLIAKLQHKNLVKLLGFCLTRMENLLVYEFIPNKSLNYILFDPKRQGELDWSTRYNIIMGIARGLLYLHEDSRPRIIHRDLKAANILLEEDMNPKIADFGLARIFKVEQTEDDTSIIAGTYGYMAPEYAMHGQFSIKSDVYSFGVLLLEIVSGKKINSKFHPSGGGDLLNYAWRSWKDKAPLNFMDPTLGDSCSTDEILRCIHLGLICVQENAHDRPTMSTIIFMLNTNSATTTLPMPQRPRFYNNSSIEASQVTKSNQDSTTSSDSLMQHTHNLVTISELYPR